MTQAERERDVFEAFAEAAPFSVLPDSIESRSPPEPDILCEIEGIGKVGFELTELIDQSYMARIGLLFKTKQLLTNYWKNELDIEDSSLFSKKYKGALLHFEYPPDSKLKERKSVAKIAFTKLLKLPDNSSGEVLKNDTDLAPILNWVNISRLDLAEIIVDTSSYGYLGDPTAPAIKKKLKKKYKCNYPIELLAHINWGIMPHEEVWLASAQQASSQIFMSPFRKIWVFDNTDKKIKYEYTL